MTAAVAVVGAGPRGIGLVERFAANADPAGPLFELHLVDPYPGGATWRRDQSALLLMNSRACDVTMFPDASVTCVGPGRTGPTLLDWARSGAAADGPPDLAAEAAELDRSGFATRRLTGEYLRWCLGVSLRRLPANVSAVIHEATALRVTGEGGRDRLCLSNGDAVEVDQLILAQGRIGPAVPPVTDDMTSFANSIGGVYVPPEFPADLDLSVLPAGEPTIVAGLGLCFFDLVPLVTEGRGGRFVPDGGSRLRYLPSGAEPVLLVGSRRGLPYRPRAVNRRSGPPCPLPMFASGLALHHAAQSGPEPADATAAVWGLICQEIGWGYYHELFHARPGATTMSWASFAAAYADRDWWDAGLTDLVATAVPDPGDRLSLDLGHFTLRGRTFADGAALGQWMVADLERAVLRATDPQHSANAGAGEALMSVAVELNQLAPTPALLNVIGRLSALIAFIGSGPPPVRLAQLAALARTGLVRFLGAGLTVVPDPVAGMFVADTTSLGPGQAHARSFVEARLPISDASTGDPLLSGLIRDGRGVPVGPPGRTRLLVDETYRIQSPDAGPESSRLAMGGFATGGAIASLSIPGTNAPFFHQNDQAARAILRAFGHAVPAGVGATVDATMMGR